MYIVRVRTVFFILTLRKTVPTISFIMFAKLILVLTLASHLENKSFMNKPRIIKYLIIIVKLLSNFPVKIF